MFAGILCRIRRNPALSDWVERGLSGLAIADCIATTAAKFKVFGQANANLLDVVLFAGDGDLIRLQVGVCFDEGLFDYFGGEADRFADFAQQSGAVQGAVCGAGCGIVICSRQARTGAVLFPLMPREPARPHNI